MTGIDIDPGIDSGDLGLWQVLIFLVAALVVGLYLPPLLRIEILVPDVRVVVVPEPAARSDQQEKDSGWDQARQAGSSKRPAGRPSIVGTAAGECNRDEAQKRRDCKPIGDRPEQGSDEVAVPVHVAVGIGRSVAEQVESILPAKVEHNRDQDEDPDHDTVTNELVTDHGLHKECKQSKGNDLRKDDDVELLDILQKLVVVIAR